MNDMAVTTSTRAQEILANPEKAKIGVVGLGYVGLPLALSFSGKTSAVVGFDIDTSKVERLMAGATYILDIPASSVP